MSDFYCDEILTDRIRVEVVSDDEDVLVFHHTRPAYAFHLVAIPKRDVPSLVDLGSADIDLLHRLQAVVWRVAADVLEEKGARRVITNLGEYQESKHLHVHIVSGDRVLPHQQKRIDP